MFDISCFVIKVLRKYVGINVYPIYVICVDSLLYDDRYWGLSTKINA